MAAYSEVRAKHATLSTTTADTVTLTAPLARVQIVNLDATTAMYATVSQTGATPATAVAAADDTYVIPANGVLSLRTSATGFVTSVVGNGNAYSVVGYSSPNDGVAFTGAAA